VSSGLLFEPGEHKSFENLEKKLLCLKDLERARSVGWVDDQPARLLG
jgi:hypothetical protein